MTIDIKGLTRFSAKRQLYRPALALAAPPNQVRVALGAGPSAAISGLEFTIAAGSDATTRTIQVEGTAGLDPSALADRILAGVDGAVVGFSAGPTGSPVLTIGSDVESRVRIQAVAVLGGQDTEGASVGVGPHHLPILPAPEEGGTERKRPRPTERK